MGDMNCCLDTSLAITLSPPTSFHQMETSFHTPSHKICLSQLLLCPLHLADKGNPCVPKNTLFYFTYVVLALETLRGNADYRTRGVPKAGTMNRLKITAGSYQNSSGQHSVTPAAKTACMNLFVAQVF